MPSTSPLACDTRLALTKGVLFDFDGVLLDSEPNHCLAWEQACLALGLRYEKEWGPQNIGKLEMDLGRRALKENNRPPEEIDRLMAEKRRIMFDLYLATPPFAGVLEFLEFLNKIGMATAIVSSSPRGEIEAVLKKWGVEKRIQKIVAQGEVAHHKPHPEPYQKGATLLGLAPEKTLVVEDSPSGLASGKAAGCLCHVLLTSFSEDRLRGADRCFENFATLAAHLRKEWAKQ